MEAVDAEIAYGSQVLPIVRKVKLRRRRYNQKRDEGESAMKTPAEQPKKSLH